MSVFEPDFNLSHMKEYLEKQVANIRVVSDLNLDEGDFKRLGVQLKAVFSFEDAEDKIMDYSICYLVYWVYTMIYWDEESGIHDELTDYCEKFPQYQIRHHIQILMDTFAGYGFYDFGYSEGTIEDRCWMLLARHAGIPDSEKYQVFELIDDYRNYNASVDAMVSDLYGRFPYRSKYIFSLLDAVSRREIVWEIRTIMALVCSNAYTKEQILEKCSHVSMRLIDYCYFWKKDKWFLEQA